LFDIFSCNKLDFIQNCKLIRHLNPTDVSIKTEHVVERIIFYNKGWGTWCRSWLRHCATRRKVAGSIPDGVTRIIDIILPATLWPWLTQPLKEMSTRKVRGVKAAGA
jgi:hypothetical protein